jgi:hypothetical protein
VVLAQDGEHFGAFVEVKRLFSTALEAKKQRRKEVTGVIGRVTGRWIKHGWHIRLVQQAGARSGVRGFVTGASDHSWDQRVRSRTQESSAKGRFDRTRPIDEIALWTLIGIKPNAGCNASGQL